MTQSVYCRRHKDVETRISCGRCGDPICPECMVHAPVGVRCVDCAKARPIPTFDVTPAFLLRGAVVGLLVGIVGAGAIIGLIWTFQTAYIIYLLSLVLIAGLGLAIGETVSIATNRKRGNRLKIVASVCMLVAFTLLTMFTGLTRDIAGLLAGAVGFYLTISRF